MSRQTVQRFLQAEHLPERQPRAMRPTQLTPFDAYLRAHWEAGCHNATQLWREICQQGFAGSRVSVAKYVQAWRQRLPSQSPAAPAGAPPPPTTIVASPRQVCWLLRRPYEALTAEEQAYLTHLYHCCPQVALAQALAQEFATLVKERDVPGLYQWLRGVELSAIPEFVGVANGIWRDRQAVEAAVTEDWSNGQVEGQVNRLKMLKRTMYGRASFAFLRLRVLHAA
jgi:transposase